MSEPLDLADMRARAANLAPYEVRMDTIALCDEIERLRAANDVLRRVALANEGQVSLLRPVVEAAVAMERVRTEPTTKHPCVWFTRFQEVEADFRDAVAAYQAHQIEPNDTNASQEGAI